MSELLPLSAVAGMTIHACFLTRKVTEARIRETVVFILTPLFMMTAEEGKDDVNEVVLLSEIDSVHHDTEKKQLIVSIPHHHPPKWVLEWLEDRRNSHRSFSELIPIVEELRLKHGAPEAPLAITVFPEEKKAKKKKRSKLEGPRLTAPLMPIRHLRGDVEALGTKGWPKVERSFWDNYVNQISGYDTVEVTKCYEQGVAALLKAYLELYPLRVRVRCKKMATVRFHSNLCFWEKVCAAAAKEAKNGRVDETVVEANCAVDVDTDILLSRAAWEQVVWEWDKAHNLHRIVHVAAVDLGGPPDYHITPVTEPSPFPIKVPEYPFDEGEQERAAEHDDDEGDAREQEVESPYPYQRLMATIIPEIRDGLHDSQGVGSPRVSSPEATPSLRASPASLPRHSTPKSLPPTSSPTPVTSPVPRVHGAPRSPGATTTSVPRDVRKMGASTSLHGGLPGGGMGTTVRELGTTRRSSVTSLGGTQQPSGKMQQYNSGNTPVVHNRLGVPFIPGVTRVITVSDGDRRELFSRP
eukprot:Sspe_Gene.59262::Locus_32542_Transcript_1_1_Confidence_1.000_Length_1793::g.59262::m.59262